MVNDEQLGGLYHEVAKWRIIDHLLDLLRLLVYVDDFARTDCLCVSELGG